MDNPSHLLAKQCSDLIQAFMAIFCFPRPLNSINFIVFILLPWKEFIFWVPLTYIPALYLERCAQSLMINDLALSKQPDQKYKEHTSQFLAPVDQVIDRSFHHLRVLFLHLSYSFFVLLLMHYEVNTWSGHELTLIVQKHLTSSGQFNLEEIPSFQNLAQDLFLLIVALPVCPLLLHHAPITSLRFLIP